jgi:uncharacterized protein (TIGR00290 family)
MIKDEMTKQKAIFNWSGGKDSSFALFKALQSGEYDISYLLTTVSTGYKRIIQHGVREELLDMQADSIGIPLYKLFLPENPDMEIYNSLIREILIKFKQENIHTGIFGDIFLEDLRKYREEKLAEVGVNAVFPIWKYPTMDLIKDFIKLGFKAVVVCANENVLDAGFAGREIDMDFIKDLPANVDPCGENGEFHSFVYDGPIFKKSINFRKGEIIKKTYSPSDNDKRKNEDSKRVPETVFWYCDLIL